MRDFLRRVVRPGRSSLQTGNTARETVLVTGTKDFPPGGSKR